MLQRQREEREDDEEEEEEDENEEDSLAARLAGLDLDKDTEKVWERLTPSERSDFERQAASGALARFVPIWRPWWLEEDEAPVPAAVAAAVSSCPPLPQLLARKPPHPSVRLAVLQALLASAAMARRLNGEHLMREAAPEAAEMTLALCPAFLASHAPLNETEAVAEVAGKLCSPPLLLVLLRDVLVLLQPCSGFQASQRALGELAMVLKAGAKAARKRGAAEEGATLFRAWKKAQFWLSWTGANFGQLRGATRGLEAELCRRTAECRHEGGVRSAVERSGIRERQTAQPRPLIEELE